MANNPCPKCGTKLWWWRDDTGCSLCAATDPANIISPDLMTDHRLGHHQALKHPGCTLCAADLP